MIVTLLRRLMQSAFVVVAMSIIVFFGVHVVGDPIWMLINPQADQAEIEASIRRSGSTGRCGSSTATSFLGR